MLDDHGSLINAAQCVTIATRHHSEASEARAVHCASLSRKVSRFLKRVWCEPSDGVTVSDISSVDYGS